MAYLHSVQYSPLPSLLRTISVLHLEHRALMHPRWGSLVASWRDGLVSVTTALM